MKIIVLLVALMVTTINVFGQNQEVEITVNAQGKTFEEAKTLALRSAITQSFGVYISSNTKVLNDQLISDEITQVSNGNIKDFEVLSQNEIPNIGFSVTLKAIVSINKLADFCKSKGLKVEFQGGTFAANIKLQELNEKSELAAMANIVSVYNQILSKCYNYTIKASDPIQVLLDKKIYDKNIGEYIQPKAETAYKVTFTQESYLNGNYANLTRQIENIKYIAMNNAEIESYNKLNKAVYPILVIWPDHKTDNEISQSNKYKDINKLFNKRQFGEILTFRNPYTLYYFKMINTLQHMYAINYTILDGLDSISPIKNKMDGVYTLGEISRQTREYYIPSELKEGSSATFTFNFWIGEMSRMMGDGSNVGCIFGEIMNSFILFPGGVGGERQGLNVLLPRINELYGNIGEGAEPNIALLKIYENLGIDYNINYTNGEIKLPTKFVNSVINRQLNILGVFNFPDILIYGNKYYQEEKNINYSNELKGCYKIFESQFDKNYNLDQISKIKNFNIIPRSMINNQTYGDFFKKQ
jgi:hypothetical protein